MCNLIGLSSAVYKGIKKKGYRLPTPIQRKVAKTYLIVLHFHLVWLVYPINHWWQGCCCHGKDWFRQNSCILSTHVGETEVSFLSGTCVFVCVYVHECVCVTVTVCVYNVHTCTHVCCVHMHVCVYACLCVCMHTDLHVCVSMHAYVVYTYMCDIPIPQAGARALILSPTRELAAQTMKFTKEVYR